jgi:hypothetical protein
MPPASALIANNAQKTSYIFAQSDVFLYNTGIEACFSGISQDNFANDQNLK